MRERLLCITLALALTAGLIACTKPAPSPEPSPEPSAVDLEFNFSEGAVGWEAGFAEYAPDMEDIMQLEAEIRPLPSELEIDDTGYYLQGMNASDDLFMFLKRQIGSKEGIVPGQDYRVSYVLTFASNAPSGAVGIGGAPGESVFVKAGATPVEPEVKLETVSDNEYYMMTVDKGDGNSGEGPAASMAGNFANGLPAEEIDMLNPPYVTIELEHEHNYPVTASEDDKIWLLVGTDSGFEGLTGIYYQSIAITLEPVE